MKKIIISLGSNTDNGEEMVSLAITWLANTFSNLRHSDIYATKAVGNGVGEYHNAVAEANTSLPAAEVTALLKKYEADSGRTPQMKALHIVPIDLDLVMYDNTIIRPSDFTCDYFLIGYKKLK